MSGSEAHTQLSVVLVSSEPTLNAKARRKEEARIRREQKLLEKKEQEQVDELPKLLGSGVRFTKVEYLLLSFWLIISPWKNQQVDKYYYLNAGAYR